MTFPSTLQDVQDVVRYPLALAHTSPHSQRDFGKRRSASSATVMLRCN